MGLFKEKPDHHDADLILKLYDLRRESVMRDSRKAMLAQFSPKTYEDFLAVTKMDHPLNAAFRQTSSYWEMAYSFAKHGIVNGDFLAENAGEGLLLYAKVQPFIPRFREEGSPNSFRNVEWLIEHSPVAKAKFEIMSKRFAPPKE